MSQKQTQATAAIQTAVDKAEPQLNAIGMTRETFQRIVLNALNKNPDIAECSPSSIQTAVMFAAQDGLMPDGREAAFVPRRKKGEQGKFCNYQPMVWGLIKLARMALPGLSISAQTVHEGEGFDYEQGTEVKLVHRPLTADPSMSRHRGNFIACYAIIRHAGKDTYPEVVVMMKADIDQHAGKYSKASKGSWTDPVEYLEMAKKTALLRALKSLPRSGKFQDAMSALEQDGDEGEGGDIDWADTGDTDDHDHDHDGHTNHDEPETETEAPSKKASKAAKKGNGRVKKSAPAAPPGDMF